MDFYLSIKVIADKLPAKTLMFIKKATGMSPTEISKKVAAGSPLFVWDSSNYRALKTTISIYHHLEAAQIPVSIFINEREQSIEYLENNARTILEYAEKDGFTEEELLDGPLR